MSVNQWFTVANGALEYPVVFFGDTGGVQDKTSGHQAFLFTADPDCCGKPVWEFNRILGAVGVASLNAAGSMWIVGAACQSGDLSAVLLRNDVPVRQIG
jgi:hypothetical protein